MTWNYRVMQRVEAGETFYTIHEVYYSDGDMPILCTKDSMFALGDNVHKLKKDMELMMESFKKPTLNYDSFKKCEKGGKIDE